jgi:SCY1-like protein 2
LVDASIKCLPVVLPILDFSTVKNEVFPPIATTFSRTSSLAIKVRSLEAFSVLCGASVDDSDGLDDDLSGVQMNKNKTAKSSILDKYTIQEKLVPSLKAIKTKEPSVMMAALKVFRQVGLVADTEFLALEVLPVLWSFSLGPLLSLSQFNDFMALIKTLSSRIEQEQRKKLQELSSGTGSAGFQNGANEFSQSSAGLSSLDTNAAGSFERLVLGKKASTNGEAIDMWGGMDPAPAKAAPPTVSASFSWSSNNTGMANQASALSQQSNLGFRSITPDQKLSSFPSLAPAAPARQTSPIAQPAAQAFSAMQPQSTSSIWGAPANANTRPQISPSGPSLPSMSTMAPSNHMSGSMAAAPNYSSFSIPPPPGGNMSPTNSIHNNILRSPSLNTTMRSTSFQGTNPIQQTATQSQGLDKYQSLI